MASHTELKSGHTIQDLQADDNDKDVYLKLLNLQHAHANKLAHANWLVCF